eukprot:9482962-Pyramimonas_sp.AAC.1
MGSPRPSATPVDTPCTGTSMDGRSLRLPAAFLLIASSRAAEEAPTGSGISCRRDLSVGFRHRVAR